jgi:hypothetical protein
MKSFRYRAYDPKQKKSRLGKLKAESVKDARARLESAGLNVLEIKKASVIEILSHPRSNRRPRAELAKSDLKYQPPLLQRLTVLDFPARAQMAMILFMAAVGLVTTFFYWKNHESRRQSAEKGNVRQTFHFRIEGVLPEKIPDETELVVRFPQVPLERRYKALDFAKSDQSFLLELDFSTTRRPDLCEVRIESAGYDTLRFSDLVFQGEPPTISLPPIRFREKG